MDLEYLKQLIRLARKSGVTELEIEEDGVRVRLRNDAAGRGVTPNPYAAPEFIGIPGYGGHPLAPQYAAPAAPAVEEAKPVDKNLHYVESPMVGTFYRAPAPDAPPFVQTGTVVDANTVVCIIEAMKVMNEIKAGTAGVIAEVMVENGQPVEFGQPLFGVKTG